MERLDKILVSQGEGSRRELQERIRRGAVSVDGDVIRSPETKIDPEKARITLDGKPFEYRRYVYIMMNKAPGLLCATRDPKAPTVLTALPEKLVRRGIFPAGRLDRDAVGLLLITDDGDAAHLLLSPARHVEKTYYVRYTGALASDAVARFARGIRIDGDELCLPATLEPLGAGEARVTVTEGRYHQVKRMIAAAGGEVSFLRRESFGPLVLDEDLAEGQWRELYKDEIAQIERMTRKTRG
ncbi:MAG: pseudouridine synthase [Clostridiaceae bacterium]|nr:pseudouridine synthase [Clostridiaceae bacterium]